MNYSEPRYTKDLDIWVEPSVKNSLALYEALDSFGAPLANIEPDTFAKPGVLYICGLPPNRFDILTRIKGVTFPVLDVHLFEATPIWAVYQN
jgi:hypothetical protein